LEWGSVGVLQEGINPRDDLSSITPLFHHS
jgi:hypothetical protein